MVFTGFAPRQHQLDVSLSIPEPCRWPEDDNHSNMIFEDLKKTIPQATIGMWGNKHAFYRIGRPVILFVVLTKTLQIRGRLVATNLIRNPQIFDGISSNMALRHSPKAVAILARAEGIPPLKCKFFHEGEYSSMYHSSLNDHYKSLHSSAQQA